MVRVIEGTKPVAGDSCGEWNLESIRAHTGRARCSFVWALCDWWRIDAYGRLTANQLKISPVKSAS